MQNLLKLEKFSNRDDTQEKAYTEESITILYFYSLRSLLVISQKGLNVLNGPEYVGLVRTQVSDSSNPERSWRIENVIIQIIRLHALIETCNTYSIQHIRKNFSFIEIFCNRQTSALSSS